MEKQLLFKIMADGKEYRIYNNGMVEGFGDRVNVVNYFPSLATQTLLDGLYHVPADLAAKIKTGISA